MITFYFIVYLSACQDWCHLFRKQRKKKKNASNMVIMKKPMPVTEELTCATLTWTCCALVTRRLTLRDIS